ncbi:MAG: IS1096 element passenger TnpR family protein, partial [Xanthobacteraceae bacterium]
PALGLRVRQPLKSEFPMAGSETLVFRASLTPQVYRAFEISDTSSLYALAHAIVQCFDFDFDHAFGFYSRLKGNIYDSPVRYELFVDMRESEGEARSVKRTRVVEAFPSVGTKMRFLFDYGDGWEFLVELVKRKPKEPKVKLPRLLMSAGKAPPQYGDPEDD